MQAVTFAAVGADAKVTEEPKPKPGPGQVLVKTIYAAMNPIDGFSASTGLLVVGWPFTLGADGCGTIVEVGPDVPSSFSTGTKVFGCTRLGSPGHGSATEYYLMDTAVTFAITPTMESKGLTAASASTLGAAVETACLGLFVGLGLPLSSLEQPKSTDETIVILGGASSVGKAAIQLAVAAGYKVLTSCSPGSAALVEKLGADWFSYRDPLETQVATVLDKTGGSVAHIFDAVAGDDPVLAKRVFAATKATAPKRFTTTNDWSGITDFEGGSTYAIELGEVGRPEATELNGYVASFVEAASKLLESGKLVPGEYEVVGEGLEKAIEAYKYQQSGKAGNKKVVVKIGSE